MASQGADENPPTITGERFNIDRPLVAGSMRVTGKGPIDVPLHVMDITTGGEILGSGSIGEDGRFAIDLGVPIPPAHIIGIQLSTPKDPNTWLSLWALQGEDARAIPQVGDFFDTALSTSQ